MAKLKTAWKTVTRALLVAGLFFFNACADPVKNSADEQSENGNNKPSDSTQPKQTSINKLDSLNRLIADNPADVNALLARARFRLKRNDERNALFDLQQAQRIDSIAPQVLQVYGELRMSQNRSREAKELWTTCARFNEQNVSCRLSLAKLYYTVQDFEKALKYVNEVIDRDRFNSEANLFKGLIVRDFKKDTARALQFIQAAIELDQDNVDALDVMGVMLTQQNDTLAPFYFRRILEKQPNRADVHYKLGVYYMQQDEINRAIESYTRAIKLDPTDADSYYNLGFIFIQLKDYREAKKYFSQAIAVRPTSYKSYYGRGYSHEMLGDVINAAKDYRKALEVLPMYTPAREGLNRVNKN